MQSRVNSLILDFKYGLITLPEKTSLRDFIFSQVIKRKDTDEVIEYSSVLFLSELITAYIESCLSPEISSSKAPNSIKTEKIHLRHLQKYLQSKKNDLLLEEVNIAFFENYKSYRKRQKISNNTLNKEISTFRSLFLYATERGYVSTNIVRGVRNEKKQPRERSRTIKEVNEILQHSNYPKERIKNIKRYRYLNAEEIKSLIELTKETLGKDNWLVPILITLAYTGMRRGELIALEWIDIDFNKNLIFVKSRKQTKKEEYRIREIDIAPPLLSTLLKQKAKAKAKESLVFPGPNGGQLSVNSLRSAFARVIRNTDFEGIGFHCLRHSFASILASKKVDFRLVAYIMGHTTREMMDLYSHVFPGDRKKVLSQEDFLSEIYGNEDMNL